MRDRAGTIRVLVLARMLLAAVKAGPGHLRDSPSLETELLALAREAEKLIEKKPPQLSVIDGQSEERHRDVG